MGCQDWQFGFWLFQGSLAVSASLVGLGTLVPAGGACWRTRASSTCCVAYFQVGQEAGRLGRGMLLVSGCSRVLPAVLVSPGLLFALDECQLLCWLHNAQCLGLRCQDGRYFQWDVYREVGSSSSVT
jgi:hypothetical protein